MEACRVADAVDEEDAVDVVDPRRASPRVYRIHESTLAGAR
jgi:hypothetical protein